MDARIFDTLSQRIAGAQTRRNALGTLFASAIGGAALVSAQDAAGKKKKKKCKKVAGKPCTSNKKCCPGKTKNICAVRSGAGNSDTTCCGSTGAKCGGVNDILDAVAPFCCQDFDCNLATLTCEQAPL
jgi:hypothetical protein